MSASPASQTAPGVQITLANQLRRLLAAVSVLVLATIGLWIAREMHYFTDRFFALYLTFGPAAIYGFGYFYWLPDVLGAPARKMGVPLAQRWSTFARLAAIGAAFGWIVWVVGFCKQESLLQSRGSFAALLAIALVPPLLMFAALIATEEYLSCTNGGDTPNDSTSWNTPLTRTVGHLGSPITKFLRAKRSLSLGGALVLASLLLNITLMSNCGDDPRKGYEIVTGKAVWLTVQQTVGNQGALTTIASQVGRAMYVGDLVTAVACLVGLLPGQRRRLLRSPVMLRATGILALLAMCDFTLGWARVLSMPPGIWALVILLCTCLVPPVLWIRRAHQPEHWDHTRLAVMIVLLPVMFFTISFGFFTSFFALYGLGAFLFGMLLLWWGTVQTHCEDSSRGPS